MGSGTTQEVFLICQPKEMLILLGQNSVPWLCDVFERYLHGEQNNPSSQTVAKASVSRRHPSFFQICQLLLAIYPGIQLDSCITDLNIEDFKEY